MTEQLFYQRVISKVQTELVYSKTATITSSDRHSKHTPEHIARVFDITMDKAKDMMSKTTQKTIRMGVNPIMHRYCSFNINLNSLRLAGEWTIDYLEASEKSTR
jgi:hypothetical protein